MKEPVRILSDLHLGHAASTIRDAEELRPLIAGAGTVVFNGDTWQELASAFRPKSERLLADLKDLCAELGAEPVFLSGNHDPGWPGAGWLEIAGGKVVVTHGDAVLWSGSPWSREAFSRGAEVRRLWEEHRGAEDDAGERLRLAREVARTLKAASVPKGRSLFRRVIDAISPPRRAWEILAIWFRHGSVSAEFARRYFPQAELIVVGHFHWPGIWRGDGPVVINTGAFVNPHPAWWVEWHDGWLRCGRVVAGPPRQLGEVTGVWRFSPD
ncbi:UDP-2,3-diacylglucosamine hydrolase [Haloferula helveola]|uniref:UDP-2,3-diacylglucosamine hydrolase n=1 Tax=Haloferula helveola TaxID=490095 RepID=A0ABN6H119_9BACT|nr:UDP-2,3-diacylglucosamine hydrolase [Haloferula helveola]